MTAEWFPTTVGDWRLRALRDRHYSTQYPGGRTCGAPGHRLAFITFEGTAGFIAHQRYLGLGPGYVCSFFRNEGAGLSSELITAAQTLVEQKWGKPSRWLTLIDETKVRHKRDPGRCFRRAGYQPAGRTKDRGLLILELQR